MPAGNCKTTFIFEIRRGSLAIVLVTAAVAPFKDTSIWFALIPITVSIQLARPVATVSVGEKAAPFPLLSVGASVIYVAPDLRCVASVLKSPK